MSTLLKKRLLLIIGITITSFAPRTLPAQNSRLSEYIALAFKNNETLQQQNLQLEKAMYALKEAHSLFLPTVSLLGDYTRAGGGRTIDFPVGDMLNPVYATLNELTESNDFPKLENASILLNPDNFYDAKFRTTLPLINAEIWYNQKIKRELITREEASANVYKRQLVKDLKTAYFRYYQAEMAVAIYNNALSLVNENIRVNESLYRNGVKNSTSLTRAETEKEKIKARLNAARNDQKNARAYFNFLLNLPLDTPVEVDSTDFNIPQEIPSTIADVAGREEITQLKAAENAFLYTKALQKAHLLPQLSTFLDLGSQAFDWEFNNKSTYYLWGINLQWNLFGANKYKYQVKQTEIDLESIESKTRQAEQRIRLQEEQALNNYDAALVNYKSAKNQLSLANKYYNDQLKLYKAGQLLYIELLDAQNQITDAQLQLSVSQAQIHIAMAELERSQASYPL